MLFMATDICGDIVDKRIDLFFHHDFDPFDYILRCIHYTGVYKWNSRECFVCPISRFTILINNRLKTVRISWHQCVALIVIVCLQCVNLCIRVNFILKFIFLH